MQGYVFLCFSGRSLPCLEKEKKENGEKKEKKKNLQEKPTANLLSDPSTLSQAEF